MKNKLPRTFILGVLVLLGACLNDKENEEKDNIGSLKDAIKEHSVFYIEDNFFMESAYNQSISIDSLINTHTMEVHKTPVINKHNYEQIDTVYELKNEGKFFKFHKGEDYEILDSFSISTPGFQLKNGIKVGLLKKDFLLKFPDISFNDNLVAVGNNEKTEIFTFYFVKDTLNHIFYSGYVD